MKTVAIVMGSDSDWRVLQDAATTLKEFGIEHEVEVLSAHRTPEKMIEWGKSAADRGIKVVIAGAGGAAHLPGMLASVTSLPVIGVPVALGKLDGMDSLLSIVQMPAGIPVGTLAIGVAGAKNAALLAAGILALQDQGILERLEAFRASQTEQVLAAELPDSERRPE